MIILLDTNVLSELIRPKPAAHVVAWAQCHAMTDLFITTITEAEIFYGLALLPEGKRRSGLTASAERLFNEGLSGRVLPFDRAAARAYAEIAAACRKAGRPAGNADVQIAAIAKAQGAAWIATRNVRDFEFCGVPVLNPWER